MKPTPPLRDERAGEHEHAGGPYILRHGDTLYRVTAATARDATAEVLAFLDDPKVWRGEIEAFTEALYRELHGEPGDVVDVEAAPDTPETRSAAFTAAMAAGDAASAYAIARAPLPADWPEDARRPWSARRELARMALDAGSGS